MTGDGSYRWVEGTITNLLDVPGVSAIIANYRDVTDRRLIEEAERDERAFSLALAELAAGLNSTLEALEIYRLLVDGVEHLLPAKVVAVLEVNEPPTVTVIRNRERETGPSLTDLLGPERSMKNLPFIWRAYQEQCAVNIADTRMEQGLGQMRSRSVLCLPILSQGEVLALLMVGTDEADAYSSTHEKRMQAMANQAAIALQNARLFRAVEAYTGELEERVRERTAELIEANQRLTELSMMKDEFISNVSHELRTPIASIKLYHTLLSRNPAKQTEYIERLDRETRRLESLVEDLLYLSRLDQRRLDYNLKPMILSPLIQNIIQDRQPLAAERQITLRYETGAADELLVLADPRLIEQCVSVLLTNALNYTPSGGHVTVQSAARTRDLTALLGIVVRDDGPGISEADQKRLFERFFRGEVGLTTNTYGTGLGLAIAREIADLLGGTLEVSSAPGQGAVFTLWLPVIDAASAIQPAQLDWPV